MNGLEFVDIGIIINWEKDLAGGKQIEATLIDVP